MRSAVAATALGMTLVLAGLASCAGPDDPLQPPGPDPSRTPVFASDEEALAAAEELYGTYNEVSNELGAAGWKDPSVLEAVLSGDALQQELETAESFAARGYRQVGDSTFDSVVLQRAEYLGVGSAQVTIYVCLDVTDVDVVDREGTSVVASTRPDRQPLEVEMNHADGSFTITRSDAWPGANFC